MKLTTSKLFFALIILLFSVCSEAQPWNRSEPEYSKRYDASRDSLADLKAAEIKAGKEAKNVLIVVGGEWCSWCHILNDYLDKNDMVANTLVANYVVVKVHVGDDGEGSALLDSLPPFKGVPHFYVVTSAGKLITSQETSQLEEGRGYNQEKFLFFLEKYKHKQK